MSWRFAMEWPKAQGVEYIHTIFQMISLLAFFGTAGCFWKCWHIWWAFWRYSVINKRSELFRGISGESEKRPNPGSCMTPMHQTAQNSRSSSCQTRAVAAQGRHHTRDCKPPDVDWAPQELCSPRGRLDWNLRGAPCESERVSNKSFVQKTN